MAEIKFGDRTVSARIVEQDELFTRVITGSGSIVSIPSSRIVGFHGTPETRDNRFHALKGGAR